MASDGYDHYSAARQGDYWMNQYNAWDAASGSPGHAPNESRPSEVEAQQHRIARRADLLAQYEKVPPGTFQELVSLLRGDAKIVDGSTHSFARITLAEFRQAGREALGKSGYYVHLEVGHGTRLDAHGDRMDQTGEEWGPGETTTPTYTLRPNTRHFTLGHESTISTGEPPSLDWIREARSTVASQFEQRALEKKQANSILRDNLAAIASIMLALTVVAIVIWFATIHP